MIKPSRLLCALLGVFTLLSFIPVSSAQDYTSELVVHWKLDETSGSTISDSSGNGNIGAWTDGSGNDVADESVTGISGTALDFSPSASRVIQDADFNFPDEGTFSAWVTTNFFESNNPMGQFPILMGTGAAADTTFFYHAGVEEYRMRIEGTDRSSYAPADDITGWFHLAVNWSASGSQIYLNGQPVGTASATDDSLDGEVGLTVADRTSLNRYWDGNIDDVRLYARSLTDADVLALYNSYYANPDFTTRMVGHWKLDQKNGIIAPDSSGNNNDGTLYGAPDWMPGGGVLKGALRIDGGTEYVEIPDDDSLDITGAVTAAAWVRWHPAGDNGGIICKQNATNSNNANYCLYISNADTYSFSVGDGSGSQYVESAVTPDNDWHHFAGVADDSYVTLYVDGVEIYREAQTRALTASAVDLFLGTWRAGFADSTTNADIDDARLYNRALTPVEIWGLYQHTGPTVGTLRYNDEAESLEYYDSREWIHAGLGSYSPNAVSFDGVDDYLQAGSVSSLSSGTKVTGSLWARRPTSENGTLQIILQAFQSPYLIQWEASDLFFTKCKNADLDDVLGIRSTASYDDGEWHHFMWSADLEVPGSARMYVDDVDVTNNNIFGDINAGNGIDDSCFFGASPVYLGRDVLDTTYFNGDFADVWIDFGTYIDLSVEENRRRFISENGMPMMLGANGSLPAGGVPDVFLSGDTVDWHENKGVISGFTENGKIVDSETKPHGGPITVTERGTLTINGVNDVKVLGNYAYVTDDDGAGFGTLSVIDISDPDSPTIVGSVDEVLLDDNPSLTVNYPYVYAINNSLSSNDGNIVVFNVEDPLNPAVLGSLSGENFYNPTFIGNVGTTIFVLGNLGCRCLHSYDASDPSNITPLDTIGTGNLSSYGYFDINDEGTHAFVGNGGNNLQIIDISNPSNMTSVTTAAITTSTARNYPEVDGYVYVAGGDSDLVVVDVQNPSDPVVLKDYGDGFPTISAATGRGVAEGQYMAIIDDSGDVSVFDISDPMDVFEAGGASGQTGLYVRDQEDQYIYATTSFNDEFVIYEIAACTNPNGLKGRMIYNSSDKVMQYCNGADWVGMGDINNGTGLGCINPTGVAGQMIYNGDYDLLQYCNSDDWIGVGKNVGSLLSTGLEGHWRLDETSGSLILDSSGNGNDGTWADTVNDDVAEETLPGKMDRSIVFDAVDDEIVVPNDETLENFEELTLSAWVYPTAIGQGSSSRIISKSNGGSGDDYAISFEPSEQVKFRVTTSSGTTNINGTDDLILNSWSHVVGTWDGSVMRVYINGIEQDNVAKFGTIDASGDELAIGMHPDTPALRYFPGRIDDARVYSRALSAEEVVLLYGSTDPVDLSTGLEGHWTMNDLSGAVVVDSSGKGRNGVWTDSDDDDVVGESENAMIAGGLRFDGVDDVATVPAFDLFGSGMTMAAWVKIDDSDADLDPRIISKADGTGVADHDWNMYIDDANGLTARVRTTGVTREFNTGGYYPPDGVWTHVAATYSVETENVVFYVNGAHYRTRSHADGGPIGVGNTARDIGLGNNPVGTGARIFDGVLDDIRLYSRPLGPTEIAELYELGAGSILTGLVGHWPLDDTSGSTIRDFSGDANDGTWSDASGNDVAQESVLAPIGTGLHFDGADDVITVAASTQLENIFVGGGTYAAWVYPETEGEGNYGRIFAKNSSFDYNNKWHMDGNRGEAMAFGVECSSNHWWWRTNTGTVPLNRWSHVAVVYDSSSIANLPTFYVNGSPVGYTTSGTCTGTVDDDASDILYIGNASPGSRDFDGNIDDARIYDRALSAGDIQALYQLGAFVASDNLLGHWRLDETSGDTLVDDSSNGYDMTWFDSVNDDVAEETVPGIIGTAVNFDGVDDYGETSLPGSAVVDDLYLSGGFSTCAWVRPTGLPVVGSGIIDKVEWAFYILDDGPGPEFGFVANTGDYAEAGPNSIEFDVWQHVCVTWDGNANTDGMTLYLNGVDMGPHDEIGDVGGTVSDVPYEMYISDEFEGDIDDVRLYDYVLSASDVEQLYDIGLDTIPTSGLVGHWSMDETSGGTISDSTGSNNGTWSDGDDDDVTGETTPGQVDRAIEFDGNDDVIETGAWDITGGDGGFTISSWINMDYLSNDPRIISKTDNFAPSNHDWAFLIETTGNYLIARITTVNGYEEINTDGAYSVPQDTWTHLTVTYDPANTAEEVRIFANGEVVTVGDHTFGGNVITGSGKDVAIGDNPASANAARNFDGTLDDVRVYNRALSVPEVRALYNATR